MSQIVLTVGGNTASLSQSINSAVNRPWNIGQLNTRGFSQPLGKITGQASEFSKSLEAANARVIAFGASALAIALVKTALDGVIGSTVQVEASMAGINSVLGLTTSQLGKFSSDLFLAASQAGVSFKDAAAAAMEFSRQGLSAEETIKRTSSALILARLSGMNFTVAVTDITAALNSFNKEALTSEEIVNRMAAVDARFAVSAADLAEGIKRVGASASDANVTFNQMLALITSVQQSTARGGAVIGNAFKTIFTRMGRPEVLQQLESLGVQTRTAAGEIRPLVDILKNLAQRYDLLGPSQRSMTAELLGGVYQINILKAAMRDLGQGTSVFDGALKAAGQSSGEANRRIEELNNTVSGKLTQTMNSFMEMSSKFGSLTIAPVMKSGLDFGKWAAENLSGQIDGDGIGEKIGEGLLKGIGNILSGPGVQIATFAILKLFGRLVQFGTVATREFFQITTEASRLQAIEQSTSAFLSKQPDLLEEIRAGRLTIVDAARRYTHELASQNEATLVLKRNSLDLAKILQTPPRGIGGQPIFPQVRATMATVAHGWVPNFNIMQREEAEARSLGASSGVRAHTSRGTIGGKRFVMNNQETEIPNFGRNGDSAVIPHYAGGNLPDKKYRYHVLDRDFLTQQGHRKDFNAIIDYVTNKDLIGELVTGAAGVGKTTYIKGKYPNASFIGSTSEALRLTKDDDRVIVTRALANPFEQHNEKEFDKARSITHLVASSDIIKQFRTKRAEDENSPTAFGRKGYTHGPTSGAFLEAALHKYWNDKNQTTVKVIERSGNSFSMRDKTDEEKIHFQELQGVLAMNGAFTPYHIGHDELYQTILEHQAQDAAENPNAMLRKAVISVARGEKRGSDVGLSVSEKIDLISRLHPEALVTSEIRDTKPGFKAFEAGGKAYEFGIRKEGLARSTAIFGPDRLSEKGENESEAAYQERTSFARQRLIEGWDVQPARRGNSRIAQATDIRAALSRQDSEGLGLEEAKKSLPPSIWHDLTYGSNLASLRNRSEYLRKARAKDKEFKTPSSTEWEKIGQSEGIDFSLEFPKQTYNEAAKHSLVPKTAEGAGQKLAESMSQEEAYAHVRSAYGSSGLFSKNRETMLNPMHVDNKALRGIENKMSDKGGIDFALLGKAGFTFDEDKRTTAEKKSALGKLTYPPKISHALLAYHSDRVGQDFYDFNDAGMRVQYAVGRYNKEKGIAAGHPDLMKLVEANLGIATEGFAKQLNPNVSQEAVLGAKENTKGFKSQIHSGAGAIFDAAFVAAFGIKAKKNREGADFDVPAINKKLLPKILSFFDLGGVSPNDITTGDFKSEVHVDGDARRSMAHKVLADSTGMPASKALSQRQKEWAEMQAEARKTGQNRAAGYIPNFAREDSVQMFDPIYKDSKGKISVADSAGYFNPRNGRVAVSDSRKSFGNSFAHEEFGHGMFSKLSKTKGFSSRLGPLLEQAKSDPSILAALNKISPSYSSQVRSPMDLVDEAFAQSIGSKFGQAHSNDSSAGVLNKFTAPLITPRMMEHISGYMGSNSAALYKRLAANKLPADKAIAGLYSGGHVPNFSTTKLYRGVGGSRIERLRQKLALKREVTPEETRRIIFDKRKNDDGSTLMDDSHQALKDQAFGEYLSPSGLGRYLARHQEDAYGSGLLSASYSEEVASDFVGRGGQVGEYSIPTSRILNAAKIQKLTNRFGQERIGKAILNSTSEANAARGREHKFVGFDVNDIVNRYFKGSLSHNGSLIQNQNEKEVALMSGGHVPNFAEIRLEKGFRDSQSRDRKLVTDAGSSLEYSLYHGALDIGYLESKKKGEAFALFNRLGKLSKRAGVPIYSGSLTSQQSLNSSKKELGAEASNFEIFKKSYPQLRYRDQPDKFNTTGVLKYSTFSEGKEGDSVHKFKNLAHLSQIVNGVPLEDMSDISIERLNTRALARGHVPNFAGVSISEEPEFNETIFKSEHGTATLSKLRKSIEISDVLVKKKSQGQGHSRELYAAMFANAKEKGYSAISGVALAQKGKFPFPQMMERIRHGKETVVSTMAGEEISLRTKEDVLAYAKRASQRDVHSGLIVNTKFAAGHVPNFNAIQDAVRREHAAGLPMSSIRVDRHPSLVSSHNPSGLGVWNTVQETGLSDGMSKARSAGINPMTKGMSRMAKGHVPNFADDSSGTIGGFGMSAFLGTLAFMIPELSKFGSTLKATTETVEAARRAQKPFSSRVEAAERHISESKIADRYSERSIIERAGLSALNTGPAVQRDLAKRAHVVLTQQNQRLQAQINASGAPGWNTSRRATQMSNSAVMQTYRTGFASRAADEQALTTAKLAETPHSMRIQQAQLAVDKAQKKDDFNRKSMSYSLATSAGISTIAGFIPQETAAGKSMSMVAETFGTAAQVMSVIPGPLGIATAAIISIPGFIKAWESWSNKSPEMAAALDVMKSEFNISGTALSEYSQAIGNLSQMYSDASVSTKTIIDTQNKVSKSLLSLTAMERGRINAQSTTEGRQRVAGAIQEEHKKETGTSERALEFEKMDELKRTRWFRPGEQEQKSISQKEKELYGGEYANLGKKETDAVATVRKKMPLLEDVTEQRQRVIVGGQGGFGASDTGAVTRQAIRGNALEVMAALLAQKAITQDVYEQHTKNLAVAEKYTKELFTRNKLEERSLKNEKEITAARTGDIKVIRNAKNAEQIAEGKRDTAIYKVDSSVKAYVGNLLQAATLADKLQSTKNSVNLQMGTDAVSLAGMRYGAGTQLRLGNEQKSQEVYTKLGEEKATISTEAANKSISSITDNILSKSDSKYKTAGGDVRINEDVLKAKGEVSRIMGVVSQGVNTRKSQGAPMTPQEILGYFKTVTGAITPEGSLKNEILKGAEDTKLYQLIDELNTTMTRGIENAGAAAVSQLAIQNQAYKGQIAILDEQRKGKMFGAAPDSRKEERDAERQLRKDKRGYERGDRFATKRYGQALTNMFGDSLPDEVVAPIQAQLAKGNAINRSRQFGIVSAGNNATAVGLRKTLGAFGASNVQELDLARARTVLKGEDKNVTAQGIAKGAGLGDMSPLINSNAALAKSTESLEAAITRLSTTPFVFDTREVTAANNVLTAAIKESNDTLNKIGEEIKKALEDKNKKDEIADEKEKNKEENRKKGLDEKGQPIAPANPATPAIPVASKSAEADSSNLASIAISVNKLVEITSSQRGLPPPVKEKVS